MNNIESQIKNLRNEEEEPYVGMPLSGLERYMDHRMDHLMDHCDQDHGMDHCDPKHQMDHCDQKHHMDHCDQKHHMDHCDPKHQMGDHNRRKDPLSGLPLAMAYVPWQCWGETYKPAEGWHRGTIFPELDLPFLGSGGDR